MGDAGGCCMLALKLGGSIRKEREWRGDGGSEIKEGKEVKEEVSKGKGGGIR